MIAPHLVYGRKEGPSFEAHEPMAEQEKERGPTEAQEERRAGHRGRQPPRGERPPILALDFGLHFGPIKGLAPVL